MRTRIYNFLVNKHMGINKRYHKYHDGSYGAKKVLSRVYLIWINICYYIFFLHYLGECKEIDMYEEKSIPLHKSESQIASEEHWDVKHYVDELVK